MTITPIKPIEHSRFIPVHRHYEQPGYDDRNQHQKRNDNKEKEKSPIKSVKRDRKTGELIIKYENGKVKRYSNENPSYSTIEENLRYQNYSTNFDFRA